MEEKLPGFTVIVPVYNCAQTLAKCLDSLSSLDYPDYEIIVVDDGSTDATPGICLAFPDIALIRTVNGGPAKARNLGARRASGDILAFTDGDCIAEPDWLQELHKGFIDEKTAGAGGNQISPADESPFGRYVQEAFTILGFATSYMKSPAKLSPTSHNPSCNAAYRKDIFLAIGGFDETLWPGEDVDLDRRITAAGYGLIRTPLAIVRHYRPQTLSALAAMMERYGGSAFRLMRRYGFFRPLQLLPFLSMALAAAAIICAAGDPRCLALLVPILAAFFLVVLTKVGKAKKAGTLCCLCLIIVFHWHAGFFKTMLSREKAP